jgi:hypothetical protein
VSSLAEEKGGDFNGAGMRNHWLQVSWLKHNDSIGIKLKAP